MSPPADIPGLLTCLCKKVAMNYLDEHIAWLRQRGLPIKAFDDVEPVPNVPEGLPEELQLWFDYRMPHRLIYAHVLGYRAYSGHWMQPDDEDFADLNWRLYPEEYVELREKQLFPLDPVALVEFEDEWLLVETEGEQAGWVYASDLFQPELGGPVAKSLSELFRAVRTLTAAGVLEPGRDDRDFGVKPPVDTPECLVTYSGLITPIGNYPDFPLEEPPIARSIRDLLPDFDFPMPLIDPDTITGWERPHPQT